MIKNSTARKLRKNWWKTIWNNYISSQIKLNQKEHEGTYTLHAQWKRLTPYSLHSFILIHSPVKLKANEKFLWCFCISDKKIPLIYFYILIAIVYFKFSCFLIWASAILYCQRPVSSANNAKKIKRNFNVSVARIVFTRTAAVNMTQKYNVRSRLIAMLVISVPVKKFFEFIQVHRII